MKKMFFALAAAAVILPLSAEVILESPKNGFNEKSIWIEPQKAKDIKYVEMDGGKVLQFTSPNKEKLSGQSAAGSLNAKTYAGKTVKFSFEYKFDLTKKKNNGSGPSFVIWNPLPKGIKYKNLDYVWDGFPVNEKDLKIGWKAGSLTVSFPKQIKDGYLNFGIADACGTVWFRNFKIETVDVVKK